MVAPYFPFEQGSHDDDPSIEPKKPAGHGIHAFLLPAPKVVEYVPLLQGRQAEISVAPLILE